MSTRFSCCIWLAQERAVQLGWGWLLGASIVQAGIHRLSTAEVQYPSYGTATRLALHERTC